MLLKHFVQNGVVNGKAALVYEVPEEIMRQFKANVEKSKGVELDEAYAGIITFAIQGFTMKSEDPLCRHIFWTYRILADDITINL